MSFKFMEHLISPDEFKKEFPLSEDIKRIKEIRDREIADIFEGKSDKFILIIGPCSADNEEAVCDYIHRLARVYEEVKDRVFIIPRIYTNKPRTTGEGYKGMLHQPDPEQKPNLIEGLRAIRHMHLRALQDTKLTAADEMLYPDNTEYFSDVLSYIAVGARSVENQQHRLVASGLIYPLWLIQSLLHKAVIHLFTEMMRYTLQEILMHTQFYVVLQIRTVSTFQITTLKI